MRRIGLIVIGVFIVILGMDVYENGSYAQAILDRFSGSQIPPRSRRIQPADSGRRGHPEHSGEYPNKECSRWRPDITLGWGGPYLQPLRRCRGLPLGGGQLGCRTAVSGRAFVGLPGW